MVKITFVRSTVRRGVYETNSSSSHSVTVRGEWDEYSQDYTNEMHCDVDAETNNIILNPDGYGWGYDVLVTTEQKLCYLVAQIYESACRDHDWNVTWGLFKDYPEFKELDDFIKTHTKYDGIVLWNERENRPYMDDEVISDDIYVDHQSYYRSVESFLKDWRIDLERYLFDYNVQVIIDNDNH